MKRKILIIAAASIATSVWLTKPLLAVDVAPASPPATQPADDLATLIKQLGDDDFHTRQSASEKLKQMGKAAIPALQEARKSSDPEIHARVDEILQDIDRPPSVAVPKATGNGSHSMRVSIAGGAKTIDVQEPGRTTHIEENGDGIAMKVTGQVDGKEVTRDYKAKTAEQLKKENPEAFALYEQYNNGGMANIQIRGGGGLMIQGQVNVGGNGGVFINPNVNPQLIQPPIVVKPVNPTGDDLDKLQSRILEQLKAANLPDDKQQGVKDLLKQLRESLPQANNADKDLDAQMREYNRRADALRKELADLKLPDPGDALPPPAWGRLGISATEETVAGQGLVVTHVLPDSRAEKIGLKEQDVIQKVNGQDVHSTRDLRKLVTENRKGLIVEGLRDGKPIKLTEPAEEKSL